MCVCVCVCVRLADTSSGDQSQNQQRPVPPECPLADAAAAVPRRSRGQRGSAASTLAASVGLQGPPTPGPDGAEWRASERLSQANLDAIVFPGGGGGAAASGDRQPREDPDAVFLQSASCLTPPPPPLADPSGTEDFPPPPPPPEDRGAGEQTGGRWVPSLLLRPLVAALCNRLVCGGF